MNILSVTAKSANDAVVIAQQKVQGDRAQVQNDQDQLKQDQAQLNRDTVHLSSTQQQAKNAQANSGNLAQQLGQGNLEQNAQAAQPSNSSAPAPAQLSSGQMVGTIINTYA